MPKVLVGGYAEQQAARAKARRELEVGEIGAAIASNEPVLFLGKIIVADASAMQLPQRLFGGSEIGDIVERLCQVQRHAIDEAAHECLPAGPQQFGPDIELARQTQRATLTHEQMPCWQICPPGNLIDPAQNRI